MAKNTAPIIRSHYKRYRAPQDIGFWTNDGGMTMKGLHALRLLSAKSYNLEENMKCLLKKIPENFNGDAQITIYSGREFVQPDMYYLCPMFIEPIVKKLGKKATIHWLVMQKKKLGKKYLLCVTLGGR